jgi:hypothetical protein
MTVKNTEEQFREKATTYVVCYSTLCPRRDHCLRSILSHYVDPDLRLVKSINLASPLVQRDDCPEYRDDQPLRMPFGLKPLYQDMPGAMERAVKKQLISIYSRKRYYQYHNGLRPLSPDVEECLRQTLLNVGWQHEPTFLGYVEEYLW